MPKRIDYPSRFEFFRQGCFALVRDRGVEALTRRALAVELGCGVNTVRRLVDAQVELVVLAADEVRTRRRQGRWGHLPDDPLAASQVLMRRLLPDDASRIDEELVWLKLVAACRLVPSGLEEPGAARREFQVAERGWSDDEEGDAGGEDDEADEADEGDEDREGGPRMSGDVRGAALAHHVDARRTEVDSTITAVIGLLEIVDREDEAIRLEALVEGLISAVCTGRIAPARAVATMDRHLTELAPPPARVAG